MKPFARWEQSGLTFELYDAGKALLYVEQDLVWSQAWGEVGEGDLDTVKQLLGPEEAERFEERLRFEVWVRWQGYPSLEDAVRRHLSEWEVVKHLPKLQRQLLDFEYNDNYRFAPKDDPAAVAEYERLRGRGCCGFHDEELTIEGRTFLFGFNWGH